MTAVSRVTQGIAAWTLLVFAIGFMLPDPAAAQSPLLLLQQQHVWHVQRAQREQADREQAQLHRALLQDLARRQRVPFPLALWRHPLTLPPGA